MRDYNVTFKNIVRDALLGSTRSSYNKALLLPGPQMLDAKMLLRANNFTKDTELHAVERDDRSVEQIRSQLSQTFSHSYLWYGDLQDMDVHAGSDSKFDFVYLDSCGELAPGMFKVIHSLKTACTSEAFVAFTFSVNGRNAAFYRSCWKYFFGGTLGSSSGPKKTDRYESLNRVLQDSSIIDCFPPYDISLYDKAILTTVILETLTDGLVDQLYLYRDTSFYMATCKIKLGSLDRQSSEFLTWTKWHLAGIKAAMTRKRHTRVLNELAAYRKDKT